MSIKSRIQRLEGKMPNADSLESLSDDELQARILDHASQLAADPDASQEIRTLCRDVVEAYKSGADAREIEGRLTALLLA